MVFGAVSIILLFIDWSAFGLTDGDTKMKIYIMLGILLGCAIVALIWGICFSNSNTIFSIDDVKIIVKYGDMLKIAFPKKSKEEKIVVLAVNSCFDTIVSQDLIKSDSMHGQFLQRFIKQEKDRQRLDAEIERSLKEFDVEYKTLQRSDKRYGKLKRYPIGSVARVNGENGVTFFLLAVSNFDIDCKACCDKYQLVQCLLSLFEYYDSHGQGKDLYIYPMGTGMSRTGLTKKDSLELITTLTKISKDKLKSKTTIIVDKRNKNDIAISNI